MQVSYTGIIITVNLCFFSCSLFLGCRLRRYILGRFSVRSAYFSVQVCVKIVSCDNFDNSCIGHRFFRFIFECLDFSCVFFGCVKSFV